MLKGVFTAIVTPFTKDGKIDEDSFASLIEAQIEAGISGIVPCGTTGESPTLNYEEHDRVIKLTVEIVDKRCEVIAGTGSNSTSEAIRMTKHAKESGVTASLQVLPYYNKPTQKGLYLHFEQIAKSVDIPIVVYNIKGRSAINMETDTLMKLAKLDNIIAVKEASGSIVQIMDVISKSPNDFSILSGDDKLTLPLMAAGGHGVVSVASNVIPKKMVDMVNFGLSGDFTSMRKIHYELLELFTTMFVETNPIPIKKILSLLGKIQSVYRLPMCEPTETSTLILKNLIKKYNLIY